MIEERPELYRELVEGGAGAVLAVDEEGVIRYANGAAGDLFGHAPGDLEGAPLSRVIPEGDGPVERFLADGGDDPDRTDVRLAGRHADGHDLELSVSFGDHDVGDRRLVSAFVRDVTGRAERERRLERFASVLSHEVRDPLNTAGAELALARARLDAGDVEGARDRIDELDGLHQRIADIVDSVLTLTRGDGEVSDADPVDIGDAAREAWATVVTGGRTAPTLDVGAVGTVRADRSRLLTLFENVLENAVTHGGPEVTVRVGSLPDGFFVADDGPGVDPEDREAVFEYGVSVATDGDGTGTGDGEAADTGGDGTGTGDGAAARENGTGAGEGSGLGLAIAREVARTHGWSVDLVESAAGGARVEVTGADVDHPETPDPV